MLFSGVDNKSLQVDISFLKKINKVASVKEKIIKKAEELDVGYLYPIKAIKIVNGKYGEIPLVEFEEFVVFLPKRMTEVVGENIQELNTGKFGLVYVYRAKGIHQKQAEPFTRI
ncbi:unnamed protein product [Brassicogethes aeneus]|uniref:Uncharacterized protein n=1 Tax=Brassicogethes aeneus TaxID=1431903 RepID=A0A9P0F8Q7_BRAAE|nr:unnamed protein product [Brassicogethes aeneus]